MPLIVSLQHLGGISDQLRTALLGNVSALLSFAVSYDDAHLIATALAAGREGQIERASVRSRLDRDGEIEMTSWSHPVLDATGRPLRLSPSGWEQIATAENGQAQVVALYDVARRCGTERLYVRAADSERPVEIRTYVRCLSRRNYRLGGPRLQLVVSFPRPFIATTVRTSSSDLVRRYTKMLMDLPVQHCLARIGSDAPQFVRVTDLSIPAARAEGDPVSPDVATQVRALIDWREAQIAQISQGYSAEGVDDGSIR
jgi:hypothetical protein